jgi:protoporphyrinogen oxidase
MDLGGHRFFSKSDWVMRWWQEILPIASEALQSANSLRINYQGQSHDLTPADTIASTSNAVMLVRRRLSRIFYQNRFFDYPLALSTATIRNLGIAETLQIGLSYAQSKLSPTSPEITLEDFFINRFGARLYRTFFQRYTEKVWGVTCKEISAEWGAQRIKGLSVAKVIGHALSSPMRNWTGASRRSIETSLIEQFLYPKFGPGQMWEEVARRVTKLGGQIGLGQKVVGLERDGRTVTAVNVLSEADNSVKRVACDYFISTLPVRDLTAFLSPDDANISKIARELPYRDFMTAGLLVRRMRSGGDNGAETLDNGMPPDNWIYIQDPDVRIGRLQVFNNWSPALVADPNNIWLGLEYFCMQGDDLWSMNDGRFIDFAARELETIGLIDRRDVLDGTLVRVPKAYPAYYGTYGEFEILRVYLEQFSNLYSIGRNGMHRYNNQDHSMLAANAAVTSIIRGGAAKSAIWRINAENEYHEQIGARNESPAL